MPTLNTKIEESSAKIIHDLKIPIIAQIAALESFLSTASSKISQEEIDLIKLTLNSCNYIQKIIETFICVQNLSHQALKLNYEKFNIVELIESCIDEAKILLKYYELKIIFNENKKIFVNADRALIKKVIENFLSNSINYAYKNTTIQINLDILNGNFILKITSNTPNIDEKIIKNIFEKNKTDINLYNKNTIGLCLYFSQKIIQAHKGNIFIKNKAQDLNVFGFSIPKN